MVICFQIASRVLDVPFDMIYTNETGTHIIGISFQTGGSVGTELFGAAVMVSNY